MSTRIPNNGKRNIVVVGGGYGALAARQISAKLDASSYNLILIDPRPYRIYMIAGARMVVSDRDALSSLNKAFAPLDKVFHNGNGTFVQGTVTSVEKTEKVGGTLTLSSGDKIPFHVLVVASGSKWSGPLAFPNSPDAISEWLETRRAEFKNAEGIVIAGAGAVGLEIAGEIKDLWPTKPVTIVHASSKPLNDAYPDKFRTRTAKNFVARGVKFVYKDYVDDLSAHPIKTRNGKTLEGDLVVAAWGIRPNTELLSSLRGSVLSTAGFVKVLPSLQLVEHPDIFALGDILDIKEQKQGVKAEAHAAIVAANVLSYVTTGKTVKKYASGTEMIVLTNGKEDGAAYMGVMWGLVFGGWFVRMVKSRELFLPMFRSGMGAA